MMEHSSETPQERQVKAEVSEAEKQLTDKNANSIAQSSKGLQPSFSGSGIVQGHQPDIGRLQQAARQKNIEAVREAVLNKSAKIIQGAPVGVQVKAFQPADAFAYPQTAPPFDPVRSKSHPKNIDETQRSAMYRMGRMTHRNDPAMDQSQPKNIEEAQVSALHQRKKTGEKERKRAPKELSKSQDYTMHLLGNEKESRAGKTKQLGKQEGPSFKGASMFQSFSASLGYSKMKEQEKENREKDVDRAKDKEQDKTSALKQPHDPKEPGKQDGKKADSRFASLSMSFKASSNYDQMRAGAGTSPVSPNPSSPGTSKPSPNGPDGRGDD